MGNLLATTPLSIIVFRNRRITNNLSNDRGNRSATDKSGERAPTFADFIDLVKAKRYTWTRLQRLACYTLLNIKTEEIKRQQAHLYLNILGSTKKGRVFLKEENERSPLFAKIGKQEAQVAHLLIREIKLPVGARCSGTKFW